MYRRLLTLAVIALAALMLVMPSSAAWGNQKQGGIVELLDLGGTDQMIDVGNDGFGPGDRMIISHVVQVTQGSWPGMNGTLEATLVIQRNGLANVSATMRLPAGNLMVSGQFSLESGPAAPFSVVGASGAYSGLVGSMTIASGGGPQVFTITLVPKQNNAGGFRCPWTSYVKRAAAC